MTYCGPGSLTIIPSSEILRNCGPERIAIVCECECGETRSHRIADLRRGFPLTMPIADLGDHLTSFCKREDCRAEFVSPDDGCAEGG